MKTCQDQFSTIDDGRSVVIFRVTRCALINEEMFGNRAPFFLHPPLHRHMLKPHAGFIDFSKAATSSSPYLGRNGAPDKQSQIARGEINLSPLTRRCESGAFQRSNVSRAIVKLVWQPFDLLTFRHLVPQQCGQTIDIFKLRSIYCFACHLVASGTDLRQLLVSVQRKQKPYEL